MKKIKVLLVYVNSMMDNLIPLNISYLAACLKEKGIEVKLFDTTFYRTAEKSSDEARVEMLQVKPFNNSEYGISYKDMNVFDDFKKLVAGYRPDLIGFSVVEPTYVLAEKLLDSIKEIKGECKISFGGIFAMLAPEKIMENPLVDCVCHGEGEKTIVEACEAIASGRGLGNVPNLLVRKDGKVTRNKKSPLVNLNELPYLDFSLFEKERFYKPMGGKVLKMVPVEFARGCPYQCTYCASPAISGLFKECGRWFRQKDMRRIKEEIEFYLKKYGVEYFYFISESFLSLGERDFGDFIDFYKNIKVPFWFNTRIETVSHDRLARLEEVNCSRISIGLESGSEYVRKHLLKRNYSNGYFTEKFKVLKDHNIEVSVNNIIGFPGETRKQIFETIALNRRVASKSSGAYIFQPFRGTYLRDYSVEKGYIDESYIAGDSHLNSDLNMPQLAKDEIAGLQRTFVLYTRLPENYLEEIKLAENFTEEGDKVFKKLAEIYRKDYS